MSRVRKGLSYVLGDASEKENHILPINAMQFSSRRNQLYTGGRDGVVKVWDALGHTPQPHFDFGSSADDSQDVAEKILKLETAISSRPLPYATPRSSYDSTTSRNYNIHFDWINDLKLVNNDRHIVTASADLSLKLIDLDGDEGDVQKLSNLHTDYVKKVSSIAHQNLVVSGGLDGLVAVWDLATLQTVQLFSNVSSALHLPNSIYALSNDNGNLISTGGPNNTINIFDRRAHGSGNLIRRLVGHQDNVRCLLMNSNYILSGSSDSTIKLWDMRNFKVYKNFDSHDDAVWSLSTESSSDPAANAADFKVFYSGDKEGNIVKTDLNYLSVHARYDEDNPYPATYFSSSDYAFIDEKVGLSTLVAKADSPIVSLCAEGDSSLFASTYTSLNRYNVPNTKPISEYQYLRTCVDYSDNLVHQLDDDLASGLEGSPADQSELNSDLLDIVSQLSMDSATNLDIQSSFSGNNFLLSTSNVDVTAVDGESEYISMFLSTTGGPSSDYVNAYKDDILGEIKLGHVVDETPVEILLTPVPANRIISIPFNRGPFQEFQVTPKSIIAKRMFNNKRWMLTLYLNGDIKIWDVFVCKELKSFPFSNNSCPLSKDDLKERTKEMDAIFQEYQTMDTLNNWCEVDIKSGKLFVTLTESSYNNVEIYYDQLTKDYPFLVARPSGAKSAKPQATADDRFWVSRILLNSLFHNYVLYEWEADANVRETLKTPKSKPKSAGSVSDNNSVVSDEGSKKMRLFTRISSKSSISQAKGTISPSMSVGSNLSELGVEFEGEDINGASPKDSILRMLQFNFQFYREKYKVQGLKGLATSLIKVYGDEARGLREDVVTYKPLIGLDVFPKDLLIIIFESSPDLGNFRDVCSFHLEELNSLVGPSKNTSKSHLVSELRCTLPKWIGQVLLYDKFPGKELPKIAFLLVEVDYAHLPPEKKIGGRSQKKIKKLPVLETSIKLTSHTMLRVSKILDYLTDKFDSRTSEMKDKRPAMEWLVLECKGEQLTNNMTLQTIKTKIWKSNTDIDLRFRRKFDT